MGDRGESGPGEGVSPAQELPAASWKLLGSTGPPFKAPKMYGKPQLRALAEPESVGVYKYKTL